jgi:septal ring factor EnvC (AmiA/AmiB activator)
MLRWPFVASALAIVALIIVLLLVSLVQGHKQLRTVQKELGSTNEQVVQDKAATAELKKSVANLKTELDAADKKPSRSRQAAGLTKSDHSERPSTSRLTPVALNSHWRFHALLRPAGRWAWPEWRLA